MRVFWSEAASPRSKHKSYRFFQIKIEFIVKLIVQKISIVTIFSSFIYKADTAVKQLFQSADRNLV